MKNQGRPFALGRRYHQHLGKQIDERHAKSRSMTEKRGGLYTTMSDPGTDIYDPGSATILQVSKTVLPYT